MMQLGARGAALIKLFEQLRLTAYCKEDGIWTVGWGHTGPEVHEGLIWTIPQAELAFSHDTQAAVLGVIRGLDVELGQNAFDALVSFTFNVGVGNEAHSTLLKLVNAGKTMGAASEFLKWVHIKGAVSSGLVRRRQAERDLFLLPAPEPVAG